jgi:very-short-patch-repair endonuclease
MPRANAAELRKSLETARRDLLDLGLRNPLLNYRTLRAKGLEIIQGDPAEIFRLLVLQEKRMTFLPSSSAVAAAASLPNQPDRDGARLNDLRLLTSYTLPQLQARLLATYHAARTSIEEQGVNTLFLAFGMLRWTDTADAESSHRAPLLLIPVELERNDARDQFHLKYSGDELGQNVSLAEKLKVEFAIQRFPDLPDSEDLDVHKYFAQVARSVRSQSEWVVENDTVVLGFFSFAKLLMYRDLDPKNWSESKALLEHKVLLSLMGADGFERASSAYSEQSLLDDQLRGQMPLQVVDADSTQSIAILDALDGHDMVIQGPPGTGKSQTIVNLIAAAAGEGKKVLFVSEKMAALDVVKRRLDKAGLGAMCLELHSNRSNKKTVLEELKRSVGRGSAALPSLDANLQQLVSTRDRLNQHCKAMNEPIGATGETPATAYGRMLATSRELDGLDLPALKLNGAQWSGVQTDEYRILVEQLQERVGRTGIPSRHPFWGSRLHALLPTDLDEVSRATKAAIEAAGALETAIRTVATVCGVDFPSGAAEADLLVESARFVGVSPPLNDLHAAASAWLAREDEITRVLSAGKRQRDLRQKYRDTLRLESWDHDVTAIRREVARIGFSWWRFLSPRWRQIRREVQALCSTPAPSDAVGILLLLDAVLESVSSGQIVREAQSWISQLFGSNWRGLSSDWEFLEQQAAWVTEARRRIHSKDVEAWCVDTHVHTIEKHRMTAAAMEAKAAIERFNIAENAWRLSLKMEGVSGSSPIRPWITLRATWEANIANLSRLQEMVAFNQITAECFTKGLSAVVEVACEWEHAPRCLTHLFERCRLSSVLQLAFQDRPALASFSGVDHGKTVERFRQLDVASLDYNRVLIARRHQNSTPVGGGAGEVGVLWKEFEKKRRHLPIRKLIETAGHAVQAIKPVLMMSPLSIANYIPPACLDFDLVVFDEASQVRPVDALGAIVRGRQIVVVGDSQQLPPTSFFDSMANTDEPDEDAEEPATADIESILGLFSARGAHQRMLKWHYRSRHESLITVSNHLFYDDRLVVFPSPNRERDAIGVVYRRLANAWYDRSRTRTNPGEARVVAEAVMAHAREQLRMAKDERLTLGVAAFSAAQMAAILDQLELLRRADDSCEEFFSYPPHEPFFIKNLENVQGDERDVIFISIGYGRTREGYLAMNFGPLNRPGGERRLNVLITRARRRCEVFTSLSADDIDTSRSPARGVVALKTFLHFAETEQIETAVVTDRAPDSDFEEQVAAEVVASGYTVHAQVGCAGFFIDLAVVDPNHPGRYVLGIECDGASYHNARSARDRDRLRQNVLEGLGWRIHRIWSTDWFNNPETELRKVLQALQTAQISTPPFSLNAPSFSPPAEPNDKATPMQPVGALSATPYELASVTVRLGQVAMHEVDRSQLAALLASVVAIESPVHCVLPVRVRDCWEPALIG